MTSKQLPIPGLDAFVKAKTNAGKKQEAAQEQLKALQGRVLSLVAEFDKNEALAALAHVDARYEAYRRAHPEEKLEALPPGKWERYLDWATVLQREGDSNESQA